MTDLSDFGAGIERAEPGATEIRSPPVRGTGTTSTLIWAAVGPSRLTGSGSGVPGGHGDVLYHTPAMQHDPATIDAGPVRVIEATTTTLWTIFDQDLVREAVLLEGADPDA